MRSSGVEDALGVTNESYESKQQAVVFMASILKAFRSWSLVESVIRQHSPQELENGVLDRFTESMTPAEIRFNLSRSHHDVESALNSSRRKVLEKLAPGSTSGLDDSELKGALNAFIQEKGSQIKTLDLKYLGLKLLPPELFKFKNLERLDLAGNNIVFIPPAIKELRNLKFLGTGMNQGIILPSYLQRDLKIEDPFSLKGTLGGMIKIKPRNFLDDIASFFSYVGSMSILNSIFKNVSPSTN